MKLFTWSDVVSGAISCLKTELEWMPPEWMKAGLQETATGYGNRLNSGYMINFEGRLRRIYVTVHSNNGTEWFWCQGKIIVRSH